MDQAALAPTQAAARACGGCTLCCKLLPVEALAKPAASWCRHCKPGQGCGAYAERPAECRDFYCAYLMDRGLDERWQPERSKLVVAADAGRVVIHVDPGRPDAWKRAPFYATIKRWSLAAAQQRRQVLVCHGRHVTAVLPDRDKPLGEVRRDQFILSTETRTQAGIRLDACVVEKDDPRIAGARHLPQGLPG